MGSIVTLFGLHIYILWVARCKSMVGCYGTHCVRILVCLWSAVSNSQDNHVPCFIQVRIMKDWDPSGKQGPKIPLPDVVTVHTPKEDEIMSDKPQIGKEKEKEGYQPYMDDAPASTPVS